MEEGITLDRVLALHMRSPGQDMVVHPCTPSIQEVETGGPDIQVILDYLVSLRLL